MIRVAQGNFYPDLKLCNPSRDKYSLQLVVIAHH